MSETSGVWCGSTPEWLAEKLPEGPFGSTPEMVSGVASGLAFHILRRVLAGQTEVNQALISSVAALGGIASNPRPIASYDELVFQLNYNLKDAIGDTTGGTL